MLEYRSSITVGNGVDRWFDDLKCYQTATPQHLMSLNVERPSFVNIKMSLNVGVPQFDNGRKWRRPLVL